MKPLTVAILHWTRGQPLPVDIALKLAAEGYNVPRLEAKYSQ